MRNDRGYVAKVTMYQHQCTIGRGGRRVATGRLNGGHTPHEGLNSANQKDRKLGVFGRKLGEGGGAPAHFSFILTNFRKKQ